MLHHLHPKYNHRHFVGNPMRLPSLCNKAVTDFVHHPAPDFLKWHHKEEQIQISSSSKCHLNSAEQHLHNSSMVPAARLCKNSIKMI
jgi:hypothetical protein